MEMKVYPKALLHYKKALTYPNLGDAERFQKAISSIEAAQKERGGKEIDGKD
jgi:hypothetical protein